LCGDGAVDLLLKAGYGIDEDIGVDFGDGRAGSGDDLLAVGAGGIAHDEVAEEAGALAARKIGGHHGTFVESEYLASLSTPMTSISPG